MAVKYVSHLPACVALLEAEIDRRVSLACQHMVNATKQTLTGQRTGRIYRVAGTKQKYTASHAGEPPAVRTGRLRNSIRFIMLSKGSHVEGAVGTDVEYAPYLEFGTSKMAPRRFLGVTFEQERIRIFSILRGGG
jgi:phage gpG-like protein